MICCLCGEGIAGDGYARIKSRSAGVTVELTAHDGCANPRDDEKPVEREKRTQRVLRAASEQTSRALALWRLRAPGLASQDGAESKPDKG